jgi:SAM-dependent methyltransferase
MNRSSKAYWEATWSGVPLPVQDEGKRGLRGFVRRRFYGYFQEAFARYPPAGNKLLELGCVRSVWLPYFGGALRFDVSGIDYSAVGCQQARQLLADAGVSGTIICADFFDPSAGLLERFDVVVSLGVAEHFDDTSAALAAFARYLRPGGLLLTSIPNLAGLNGRILRAINQPLYDIHVPLSRGALRDAHVRAGLEVLECDYFLFTHLGLCSLDGLLPRSVSYPLKQVFASGLLAVTAATWLVEERVGDLPPNALLAPYIQCVARKPAARGRGSDEATSEMSERSADGSI